MDYLQKALEKSSLIGLRQQIEKEIVYTHSKQHSLNMETLLKRRVIAMQKHTQEYNIFKMLRTKILKQLRANGWNSFGVSSATRGAGTSLVSVNLAISMAMELNQTVLLVDMDLKSPKIAWYFDIDVTSGLQDYINSDKPLSDILINPGINRLVILPGRGYVMDSSEMLSAPKMRRLIEEIKSRYQSRIIIFDLPPILGSDDVLVSMDYYDTMLLVVEEGGDKPEEVKKALQLLAEKELLGTVLNKAENPPFYQEAN